MAGRNVGIALVLIVVLFLALGTIIALRYVMGDQGEGQGGVSLYFGRSSEQKLNLQPAKVKEVVKMIRERHGINSSKAIVMFGTTTCPYCKAQDEMFSQQFKELYKPLWVNLDEKAQATFIELVSAELQAGASPEVYGVPHTVVVSGDDIKAIVIGLVRERSFWEGLLKD
ncbi:MAG: thioredoxin fold domain-containing protein [Acidilobaceae archaeon]